MLCSQDGTEPQQSHITSGSEVEQSDGPELNQQAGPRADNPLLMPSIEPLMHGVHLLPTGRKRESTFFERESTLLPMLCTTMVTGDLWTSYFFVLCFLIW